MLPFLVRAARLHDPYPPISPKAMTGVFGPENFGAGPFLVSEIFGEMVFGWRVPRLEGTARNPHREGPPKGPMPSPRAVRGYAFLDMAVGPVDQLAAGWAEVSHLALLLKLPHKYLTHQALIWV